MALVPATITVNWISNYIGPHRVCYRVVGSPTWICTQPGTPDPGFHPNCAGQGNPCSYDIDIMVDNETCVPVDYEIYTQAACETEISTVGRDPVFPATYLISFIPDPACDRYEVTCDDSPMGSTNIDTPANSGYTNGAYPGLPIVGGGGAAATVDVTVAGGVITVATLSAAGSGYTGTGLVDITSIVFGGPTPTTITVTPLGCTALTIYDCPSGATADILPLGTFQPGETYFMCNEGGLPTVPADYTAVEDGNCLCNCVEQDLQNTDPGGTIDYTYIDCNGAVVTGTLAGSASTGDICMVDGSLNTVVNAPAVEAIVVVGPCDAA